MSQKKCCSNELFWMCSIYNIDILPRYINTRSNVIADALSRIPYSESITGEENLLNGSNLCCLNLLSC